MIELPRKLSEDEAAEAIGVSKFTLRRLRDRGKIRAFRPTPRKCFYLTTDIADFIERSRTPCPDASSTSTNAAGTISAGSTDRPIGTSDGTIPTHVLPGPDAVALARRILNEPRSSSRSSSAAAGGFPPPHLRK
jgi:hypothetical protein